MNKPKMRFYSQQCCSFKTERQTLGREIKRNTDWYPRGGTGIVSDLVSWKKTAPPFFFLINLKPWWCKCSWGLHGLLGFFQLKGCSMMATTLLQTTSQQVIPTPPGKEGETTIEVVGSTTLRHLCSWKRPWKCKKWNSEFMRPTETKLFTYKRVSSRDGR